MTVQYKIPEDLPKKIRQDLSVEAQELYVAVYRRTWEKCHMGDEGADIDLAETAHDAAMLAVKTKFQNQDGRGTAAPIGSRIDTDEPGDDRHGHGNKPHPKEKPDP